MVYKDKITDRHLLYDTQTNEAWMEWTDGFVKGKIENNALFVEGVTFNTNDFSFHPVPRSVDLPTRPCASCDMRITVLDYLCPGCRAQEDLDV